MKIVSVNIGKVQPIQSKSGKSGIFKKPTSAPVAVHVEGLANDAIVDVANHGGVDQAVYIYGLPDYTWWSQELEGYEMTPGLFGENLTLSELESASLNIGDRLHIADVILEVTSPRIPCVTLATRMNDPQFVRKFVQGKRYGAYCRVIQTGNVQVGNPVELESYQGMQISINEMADAFYRPRLTREELEQFLSVPVAIRARQDYEQKLQEFESMNK